MNSFKIVYLFTDYFSTFVLSYRQVIVHYKSRDNELSSLEMVSARMQVGLCAPCKNRTIFSIVDT